LRPPVSFPIPVKAVLFDLDGTLVDTGPDLAAAVNRMLAELGRAPVAVSTVLPWVGNGMARLVKRALTGDMQSEPDPASFERGVASFKKHYAANLAVDSRPYPGTLDALMQLKARGFRLACVTNKPAMFTVPLLAQLGMNGYFGSVVSGDTLTARKPDPEPLMHACRELGIAPGEAVMVGDSANDIAAARAAGMPAVAVSYGYNHGQDVRTLNADRVVDSLAELPQYLSLSTTT
jgi:phosphoglycolate phosphatase